MPAPPEAAAQTPAATAARTGHAADSLRFEGQIEGLRAVAAWLVLLFHAEIFPFSGGYIGVDVFFVISGYLISSRMLREIDGGRFSILDFYERRVRRIAPALLAAAVVGSLFVFLLPPARAGGILQSLLAAIFSVANFYFYLTTDYFTDTSLNPFLHTWSLSVEEQFYLFLPPFLLAVSALVSKHRRTLLGLLALLSLAAAEWTVRHDPGAAFHMPWLRCWELLAGTLLASVDLGRIGARARDLLSLAGLALIAWASVTYTKQTPFPGVTALVPVLGAAAIIAGCGSRIGRLALETAPMRFFGKISYSFYLAHWLAISLVTTVLALSPKAKILIVAMTVVMGWASWRFVETPFRKPSRGDRRVRRRVFVGLGVSVAAVIAVGLALSLAARLVWNREPEALRYADYLRGESRHLTAKDCWFDIAQADFSVEGIAGCLQPRTARPRVLLFGDSHAHHLAPALAQHFPALEIISLPIAGCLPVLDFAQPARCANGTDEVLRRWVEQQGPSLAAVLLSARWRPEGVPALRATVEDLSARGIAVRVLGPSPEYRIRVPLMLAYEQLLSMPLAARVAKPDRFEVDRLLQADPAIAARYVSMIAPLCEGQTRTCLTQIDGIPLYSDRDHFSAEGARYALRDLRLDATPPPAP